MNRDQRRSIAERLYGAFVDDDLTDAQAFPNLDQDKRAAWDRVVQKAEDLYLAGVLPDPAGRDATPEEETQLRHLFFAASIPWDMPTARREAMIKVCRLYAGAARAVMTTVPPDTCAGSQAEALRALEASWLWAMRAMCSVPR